MKKFCRLWLVLFFALLFFPAAVLARETHELESCFRYFDYGEVKVSLTAAKSIYLSGETVNLAGEIINKNDFPLQHLVLYTHIKRVNDSDFANEGHFLIDRKTLLEDLSLLPGETRHLDLELELPSNYPAGDYQLQYFVFSEYGFHYSGRPFLEEDTAGVTNFTLRGKEPEIYFDPGQLFVNGEKYELRGLITELPPGPVSLKVALKDGRRTQSDLKAEVSLYSFDDAFEENLLSRETVPLTQADGFILEKTIDPQDPGAYVLVVAIDWPVRTMFKYRLALTGDQPPPIYLSDLGLTGFPPAATDRAYVCFHTMSEKSVSEATVNLTVADSGGKTLDVITYRGEVSPEVSALSLSLSGMSDPANIRLKADIIYAEDSREKESREIEFNCDGFSSGVADFRFDATYESEKIEVVPIDACGREIAQETVVDSLVIRDEQGSVVSETYNTPVTGLSLTGLAPGRYSADILLAGISKNSSFEVRKKSNWLWLMFIILLLIVAFIIYLIYRKKKKKKVKTKR